MNGNSSVVLHAPIGHFGHRQVPPRACVIDSKPHIRIFLSELLEQLGFITHACGVADVNAALTEFFPDLIVLGPLGSDGDVPILLRRLSAFRGKIMLFGGRSSPALIRDHEHGEKMGLAMLPPLGTPFRDGDIKENLRSFLPISPSPAVPVDVEEALRKNWFEIWYQPKIDPRLLTPRGAEAVIRVRHPTWGLVSPAYFVPAADDPYFHRLSQFVLTRVVQDWLRFAAAGQPVDLSVHLPTAALEDMPFIDAIFGKLPPGICEGGLLIEIDCADLVGDFALIQRAAAQLAFRNIGIAIDAVGAEGAVLAGRRDLPVVEIKADRRFVSGCGNDRVKQAVCAAIAATARESGARSVAVGVETQADYLAVRDLGFDLVQGAMFAKPMPADKFERAMVAKHYVATG
jgi:EAL domain-containing protein (putative c-di-GMP-specific phosphodiesterase class I)